MRISRIAKWPTVKLPVAFRHQWLPVVTNNLGCNQHQPTSTNGLSGHEQRRWRFTTKRHQNWDLKQLAIEAVRDFSSKLKNQNGFKTLKSKVEPIKV